MSIHRYAIIMAGGSGTRLFPRSRDTKPKQFQKIIGDETLIVQTFKRVNTKIPVENIYISTNEKYIQLVKNELPSIAEDHIITEPAKRNTAPAMALVTALIVQKDPDALIMATPADHILLKTDVFTKAIETGFSVIEKHHDHLLTVGIYPSTPHTGYGYIERDNLVEDINRFSIYKVKRFVEKPDKKTAETYLAQGTFYWNAAYFMWQGKHFLREVKKYLPGVYRGIEKIIRAKDYNAEINKEYYAFPDLPVDTAIMEKTEKMLVIPADLGWSDIGSWDAVNDIIDPTKRDQSGNYTEGRTITIDTRNSLILGSDKKLIATIGLENIIAVATDDVIIIAAKGRSEEVKKIIEELKNKKLDQLL